MFDIKEELKKLPKQPGVYLMKDAYDNIIYVGKAIVLKNRVRQYFQNSAALSPKIARMVQSVASFEYIVTDSEVEALILENNLIKKHQPKYNTMLKDDKSYPYIKVTVDEPFPRVLLSRELKKDKAKYYGPYTNSGAARETIDLIRKIWKIRHCSRVLPRDIGKERECLYYHIHQCDAPCQGWIDEAAYREHLAPVIDFLEGHYEPVLAMLRKKMEAASEALDFEKAAENRDQLRSVQAISEKQKIIDAAMDDRDIIAFARNDKEAVVQVYFIRNGKIIGREQCRMEGIEDLGGKEVMTNFVKQFYAGTPYVPKELMLQEDIDEASIIQSWLSSKRGRKVYIKVPRKGGKSKLVEMAAQNAAMALEQFGEQMRREEKRTKGAMQELADYLELEEAISRVEAYDISNTSGVDSVGSMVVFEDGKPKKNDYRKFKIKWSSGPNDYGQLEEVLTRRLNHALEEQKEIISKGLPSSYGKFTRLPDLILMDGGKGQVNAALKALDAMGLDIPVCGMVKDDRHRTRGLYYRNREVPIDTGSECFKLVTRIQDEAHRFAIDYHRKLRSKRQVKSVLEDIPGIGPAARKVLLGRFGSVHGIAEASLEELMAVPGLKKNQAEAVHHFFHHLESEEGL